MADVETYQIADPGFASTAVLGVVIRMVTFLNDQLLHLLKDDPESTVIDLALSI